MKYLQIKTYLKICNFCLSLQGGNYHQHVIEKHICMHECESVNFSGGYLHSYMKEASHL